MSIILSDHNTILTEYFYNMALVILNIDQLEVRRFKLSQKFAKQTLKLGHADIFRANQNQYHTRLKPEFFLVIRATQKGISNHPSTIWLEYLMVMKSSTTVKLFTVRIVQWIQSYASVLSTLPVHLESIALYFTNYRNKPDFYYYYQ